MHRLLLIGFLAAVAFPCSWDYPIWIPRDKTADPLYRFVKNGKAGYIDTQGRVVIPPTLRNFGNSGYEFHDGLLEVSANSGEYVDKAGKVAFNLGLFRGWDFSEGLAVAMKDGENLWGYIDTTGKFAITPRFATYPDGYVQSFSDGVANIKVKDRFGFIDRSGAFVIPPRFIDATGFFEGMARVVVDGPCVYFPDGPCGIGNAQYPGATEKDRKSGTSLPSCKFTYIDKSGSVVTSRRFDSARRFSEGLAPVKIGGLWGFVDQKGNDVIAPKFEDAEPFSSGLARVVLNGKFGYVDKNGRIVISPQFTEAESFTDGLAVVGERSGRSWYINAKGEQAFQGSFVVASPFFKGLAHVQVSRDPKSYAYIDITGRVVFRY